MVTMTPPGRSKLRPSARSAVNVCPANPIQGREIRPVSAAATTVRTILEGMANPIPIEPPLREKIAVLIPMSLPSSVIKAPPEFPGLMAASV